MYRGTICLVTGLTFAALNAAVAAAQSVEPVEINDSPSLVESAVSNAYSNVEMDQPACSDYTGELSCNTTSLVGLIKYEDPTVVNCEQKADYCECNAQFTIQGECVLGVASQVTQACPHGCKSDFIKDKPIIDCLADLIDSDPKMADEIVNTPSKPVSNSIVIDRTFRIWGKCGGKTPGLDTFVSSWITNNPGTLREILAKNYCDSWFAELPNKLPTLSWRAEFACKGELSYSDSEMRQNNY